MNVLIIGSGELGSRHLQGALKVTEKHIDIYVLDVSEESLSKAKERAREVESSNSLNFISEYSSIPSEIFLVINATTADKRLSSTLKMLQYCTPRHVILEKVVFQSFADFEAFEEQLTPTHTEVYVNHPRRYFDGYINLPIELGAPIDVIVVGDNWGLGCNGLHFIDLIEYLTNESLCSVDTSLLNEEIIDSKRPGFVEFTGVLTGVLSGGSKIIMISNKLERGPIKLSVRDANNLWVVNEGLGTFTRKVLEGDIIEDLGSISIKYQSSLTSEVIVDLIQKDTCQLTPYVHSREAHKVFLSSLLKFYNGINKSNLGVCPIS